MEGNRSPVIEEVRVPNAAEVPRPEGTTTNSSSRDASVSRSDDGTDTQGGGAKLWTRVSLPAAMCLDHRLLQLVSFGSWPCWAISPKVPCESRGKRLFQSRWRMELLCLKSFSQMGSECLLNPSLLTF
jgi:hypothetical protein